MTQATPTAPQDTRPTVAGHPLPWKVSEAYPNVLVDADGAEVMDFTGERHGTQVEAIVEFLNQFHSDDFFVRAHEMLNRGVMTHEEASAMWGLTSLTIEGPAPIPEGPIKLEPGRLYELPAGEHWHGIPDLRVAALESALIQFAHIFDDSQFFDDGRETGWALVKDILTTLGLAHRLEGNSTEAEQVTA